MKAYGPSGPLIASLLVLASSHGRIGVTVVAPSRSDIGGAMVTYHVEIKTADGRVVRGIVAKSKQEAQKLQRTLQKDPLVPPGGSVTIRAERIPSR